MSPCAATFSENVLDALRDFLRMEAASGMVLVAAAVLAMAVANSPAAYLYAALIELPLVVAVGDFELAKPLLLWVNDGLMAVFFFLVGLELKRELLEGELSDLRQVALPGFGAVGGMAVPALLYVAVNRGDPVALQGWAIPAATDIAFALAILGLLGPRVPLALKVFLVSVAIFDDLGAIVIIALFYTQGLSVSALAVAGACLLVLLVLNRRGVLQTTPYLFVGLVLWVALLKSGVHATLAGVAVAAFIPLRADRDASPLHRLEHDLHAAVAWFVLPTFAFVNAGIPLAGMSPGEIAHPVPIGILLGLVVGKPVGVLLFCALAVGIRAARLPEGVSWAQLVGAAQLCGVGFTMSLFIGSLAFEQTGVDLLFDERLGIIAGSLLSGLFGWALLRSALPRSPAG